MDETKKVKERNVVVPKTPTDLQRMKLERLMENPEKPVIIPDPPKQKKTISVPEFVRNVMGSSAGAGSGEFHVYRHLRRKEYARQKYIEEKAAKEKLDEEFHKKIEENRKKAELKTAKKRAKRLKRKEKKKAKKAEKASNINKNEKSDDDDSDDSEGENTDNDDDKTEN